MSLGWKVKTERVCGWCSTSVLGGALQVLVNFVSGGYSKGRDSVPQLKLLSWANCMGRAGTSGSRTIPSQAGFLAEQLQEGGEPQVIKSSRNLVEKNGFFCKMINRWYESVAKCRASLMIPVTCQQPLKFRHKQLEPLCKMCVGWEHVAQASQWALDGCWVALNHWAHF